MKLELDNRDLDIVQLALLTVGQVLKNDDCALMYFELYEKISCQRRPCFASCKPDGCCILSSKESWERWLQPSASELATTGGGASANCPP